MHLCQHFTHRVALCRIGGANIATVQAAHQAGGLAGQQRGKLVVVVGNRRRAGYTVARQVAFELQEIRQLFQPQYLEQRQHITAVRGGNEVIGIGNAGGDAFEFYQLAQRVAL